MINEQQLGMALSLSSRGAPGWCPAAEPDRHCNDWEDSDEESPIVFTTSESRCEQLYHRGLEMQCRNDLEGALSCFLKCLEGMQSCEYFAKLPQTLHQLSVVYSSLECSEKAREYARAEKLFYQVVVTESPKPASGHRSGEGGGARSKGKRKLFSKKPKPATNDVCNPADYFPVLAKRAEAFHRLSRTFAQEGKFDIALDHCSKAATIRECIYGQHHYLTLASLDLYKLLYREASIHMNAQSEINASAAVVRGDLSSSGNGGTQVMQSDQCGGAQIDLSATPGVCREQASVAEREGHSSEHSTMEIASTLFDSKESSLQPTQGTVYSNNRADTLHSSTRADNVQSDNTLLSTTRGLSLTTTAALTCPEFETNLPESSPTLHCPTSLPLSLPPTSLPPPTPSLSPPLSPTSLPPSLSPPLPLSPVLVSKDQQLSPDPSNQPLPTQTTPTCSHGHESPQANTEECASNSIHETSRQDKMETPSSRPELQTIWGRVQDNARPLKEIKINVVYTGVRNNLNKLSEIKTPLCVNLDPHKGAGEDASQTRCLPMWVLLLPAFLALLGYMLITIVT